MCIWYSVGKCRNSANCRFAHGKEELRGIPAEQEVQESVRQQALKGPKAGKAASKEDRKQKEGNNAAEAPKSSKTKARAARRAAGKALTEAPSNQEDDLAPVQEETQYQSLFSDDLDQPMFVQPPGARADFNARFELPPQVHHELLERSGFLAPLRSSEDPVAPGHGNRAQLPEGELLPPPGLPASSLDFNIFPDRDFAQGNGFQNVSHPYDVQKLPKNQRSNNGEINKLAESIKSLSEQLTTLQQCIVHQADSSMQRRHPQKSNKVVGRLHTVSGHSDSTKSGSDYNGSSPPSTPGSEKHKNRTKDQLSQLTEFSRELNWALGSQMNLIGQLQQQQMMAQELPKQQQWFAQL
jgi:hypothetical protein